MTDREPKRWARKIVIAIPALLAACVLSALFQDMKTIRLIGKSETETIHRGSNSTNIPVSNKHSSTSSSPSEDAGRTYSSPSVGPSFQPSASSSSSFPTIVPTATSFASQNETIVVPMTALNASSGHSNTSATTLQPTIPATMRREFNESSPRLVVDIMSVGSNLRRSYLEAQQRTWASHPTVRNFFPITEDDDYDPYCAANMTRDGWKEA